MAVHNFEPIIIEIYDRFFFFSVFQCYRVVACAVLSFAALLLSVFLSTDPPSVRWLNVKTPDVKQAFPSQFPFIQTVRTSARYW